MEWVPNNVHGPGCDQKMLLRGGFSSVIRNMWLMRGNPGSVNMVHSGGDHQIMYMWVSPTPDPNPRDSRTYGARIILRDHIMQARQGDVFYAGGAPRRDEHGLFDESPKEPLIYLAIGALPQDREEVIPLRADAVGAVDVAALRADPHDPAIADSVRR